MERRGAPVWVNVFWNRRIERVYDLGKGRMLGPMPQTPLVVAGADGRLATHTGNVTSSPFVLASQRIAIFGTRVASSGPARLTLGSLELAIVAREAVRVEIERNSVANRRVRLAAGDRWSASVRGQPRLVICRFTVRASSRGLDVDRFDFVRAG